MKKDRENWVDLAPDAIMGYTAVVLGIVVFVLALGALTAGIRWLVSTGFLSAVAGAA